MAVALDDEVFPHACYAQINGDPVPGNRFNQIDSQDVRVGVGLGEAVTVSSPTELGQAGK